MRARTWRRCCATNCGRSSPMYEEIKRRAGRLDFLDLLLVARNLVRDNAAVRAELQSRFTHIFVDEFQDTDPLQAEILLLLAAADPAETNWLKVKPVAGQAVHRRRSQTVDLPVPSRRRFALPGRQAEPADAWCGVGASDGQLSRDARYSDDGQCRVRAADERGIPDAARVCAADAVSRRAGDATVDRGAAGAGAVRRFRSGRRIGESTSRFPRRLAPSATGWCTRAAGR